jgi:hypothetical protein
MCTPDQEIIPTCIGITSQYKPFHSEFSYSLIKRSVKPLVIVFGRSFGPKVNGATITVHGEKVIGLPKSGKAVARALRPRGTKLVNNLIYTLI